MNKSPTLRLRGGWFGARGGVDGFLRGGFSGVLCCVGRYVVRCVVFCVVRCLAGYVAGFCCNKKAPLLREGLLGFFINQTDLLPNQPRLLELVAQTNSVLLGARFVVQGFVFPVSYLASTGNQAGAFAECVFSLHCKHIAFELGNNGSSVSSLFGFVVAVFSRQGSRAKWCAYANCKLVVAVFAACWQFVFVLIFYSSIYFSVVRIADMRKKDWLVLGGIFGAFVLLFFLVS